MKRTLLITCAAASIVGCGGTPQASPPRLEAAAPTAAAPAPPAAPPSAPRCARLRPGTGPVPVEGAGQGGAVALARLGDATLAYAADEDDGAIHTFDVDRAVELAITPLPGAPAQIALLPDGRVAAALRDVNRVVVLEPGASPSAPLELRCEAAAPAEPWGLAVAPGGARLAVTSGWGRALSVLDTGDLSVVRKVSLGRDPRGVIFDGDGRRAFVTHLVGGRMSIVDLAADTPAVHAVDVRPGDPTPLAASQGYALVRVAVQEGAPARVYAPVASVSPGRRESSFGYGGSLDVPSVEPLVSVIDPVGERVISSRGLVDLQSHRRGCLLPRAAAATAQGTLLVACQGIDALVELDARSAAPATAERRRFRVPAGPTGVAVDAAHGRAVVFSQFARELAVVDLSAAPLRDGGAIASAVLRVPAARRAEARLTAEQERGRVLFHVTDDPRISRDGRACASCHPEGREDSLTWSTPDGPRQTIMLAGRLEGSAPYGWFGKNRSVRDHVTQTFTRLGGTGLTGEKGRADLDALMAWLGAMRGPSSAGAAQDPDHVKLAARGRELYSDPTLGCATCHYGGGTDNGRHDVKSGDVIEASVSFDTPSLRYVSATAPYFHDGRYATLEEMLERSDGRMGHTQKLSRADLLALVAYLEDL